MSEFSTGEVISYVLGDAPPELAAAIASQLPADPELSAKVTMFNGSLSGTEPDSARVVGEAVPLPSNPIPPPPRRRMRWRVVVAASVGFLALSGIVWGAWELFKPKPLLQDSFARPWFDSTVWHSERPIVRAEKGYLAMVNRGSVRTQKELRAPFDLRFEWRWRDLAGYPHYSETLSVALSTTGKHDKEHSFYIADGIVVAFQTYPGRVGIVRGRGAEAAGTECKDGTLPFGANEWYRIRITDDGDEVAVYVRGPEIDEAYWTKPVLKQSFAGRGGGSYFSIFNREAVGGVPHESHIRNLEVWPLPPPEPKPGR